MLVIVVLAAAVSAVDLPSALLLPLQVFKGAEKGYELVSHVWPYVKPATESLWHAWSSKHTQGGDHTEEGKDLSKGEPYAPPSEVQAPPKRQCNNSSYNSSSCNSSSCPVAEDWEEYVCMWFGCQYEFSYDVIVDINSLPSLLHGGAFYVMFPKNTALENFVKPTGSSFTPGRLKNLKMLNVAMTGIFDCGKTYLTMLMTNSTLPSGIASHTYGLSGKRLSSKLMVWDPAGSGLSVPYDDVLLRDRLATDAFVRDVLFHMSDVMIFVVNTLTLADQVLLGELVKNWKVRYPNRDMMEHICLVHNFKAAVTIEDLNFLVKQDLIRVFGAELRHYDGWEPRGLNEEDAMYWQSSEFRHFVLMNGHAEYEGGSGKSFNDKTMLRLQDWLNKATTRAENLEAVWGRLEESISYNLQHYVQNNTKTMLQQEMVAAMKKVEIKDTEVKVDAGASNTVYERISDWFKGGGSLIQINPTPDHVEPQKPTVNDPLDLGIKYFPQQSGLKIKAQNPHPPKVNRTCTPARIPNPETVVADEDTETVILEDTDAAPKEAEIDNPNFDPECSEDEVIDNPAYLAWEPTYIDAVPSFIPARFEVCRKSDGSPVHPKELDLDEYLTFGGGGMSFTVFGSNVFLPRGQAALSPNKTTLKTWVEIPGARNGSLSCTLQTNTNLIIVEGFKERPRIPEGWTLEHSALAENPFRWVYHLDFDPTVKMGTWGDKQCIIEDGMVVIVTHATPPSEIEMRLVN